LLNFIINIIFGNYCNVIIIFVGFFKTCPFFKLTVKSLPKHMPEFIEIDISELELGKSIKVGDLEEKDYEIINSPLVNIVSVNIPRVTLPTEEEEDVEGEEGAEGEEGTTEGKEQQQEKKEGEGGDKKDDKPAEGNESEKKE